MPFDQIFKPVVVQVLRLLIKPGIDPILHQSVFIAQHGQDLLEGEISFDIKLNESGRETVDPLLADVLALAEREEKPE